MCVGVTFRPRWEGYIWRLQGLERQKCYRCSPTDEEYLSDLNLSDIEGNQNLWISSEDGESYVAVEW